MWAEDEVRIGDVLWNETFTGGSNSNFSATNDWTSCVNPTMFKDSDKSSLSYASSNAMCSTQTGGNMTGAHVWLNKNTTGQFSVKGIPLYNAKKIKVSYNQGGSSKVVIYYALDGGSFTELYDNSTAGSDISSNELNVEGHTSIALKWSRTSTKTNVRIDDLKIIATEVVSSDPSSSASFADKTPSINFPGTATYSQVASTVDGYDNSLVEYSITANTAGATLVGNTLTVTQEGSVTVKATAPATTGFAKSEDTYTLTVNDTRSEAGLEWSTASAAVTYKELPYELPSLTNPHGLVVAYSSSDESVATITSAGELTIKNVTGNTTISASFAGDVTYKSQVVSYTLNVTKGAFEITDGVFDFVGAGNEDPLVDYGSGVTLSTGDYVTADKTWTAGNVTMVTKMVSGNGYRWWNNDKTLRFYNECTATFSVPSGYVITKIVTTGANFDSADEGTLSSSTWTGLSNTVTLHATAGRNVKTITVTYMDATYTRPVTADKWGTLCLPYNATVEGATLYTFEGVDNTDAPTVAYFEEAASVEAGKPYFFKATGTTLTATYTSGVAQEAGSAKGAIGTLEDMDVAEGNYLLSNNELVKCGTGCTLAANRVYVDMTAASVYSGGGAVKMGVDLTDGISVVDAQSANATAFDLSGRRVVKPTKGLYIVNGKKVVIK